MGTMRLKPASAVSCLGPSGGPLSCLVAAAQPSQSAHDSLCLQEGRTCLMRRWYLQAGVSRFWDQERLPGGQAGPSGPLHSHSNPTTTTAFFPHVHPSNALGHMGRCPRPAIQTLTPPLDYDLTLAPPSRWESPPPDPAGLSCLSPVPLLVGPNQESKEGGPLTVAAPGSFQSGSVRGEVIFSCSLRGLLGCKSQSLLGYGFMCCKLRHRGVPVPAR